MWQHFVCKVKGGDYNRDFVESILSAQKVSVIFRILAAIRYIETLNPNSY